MLLWIVKYCLSVCALCCLCPQQGLWICECCLLLCRTDLSYECVLGKKWKQEQKNPKQTVKKAAESGTGRLCSKGEDCVFASCEVAMELADNNVSNISLSAIILSASIDLWVRGLFFGSRLFFFYKSRPKTAAAEPHAWQHPENDPVTPNTKLCVFVPWMLFFPLCQHDLWKRWQHLFFIWYMHIYTNSRERET